MSGKLDVQETSLVTSPASQPQMPSRTEKLLESVRQGKLVLQNGSSGVEVRTLQQVALQYADSHREQLSAYFEKNPKEMQAFIQAKPEHFKDLIDTQPSGKEFVEKALSTFAIDGLYGRRTELMIRGIQDTLNGEKNAKLSIDGQVGKQTLAALEAAPTIAALSQPKPQEPVPPLVTSDYSKPEALRVEKAPQSIPPAPVKEAPHSTPATTLTTSGDPTLHPELRAKLEKLFDGKYEVLKNSDGSVPSFENGIAVRGRLHGSDYPKDTAIYFPKGYQPESSDSQRLLVHLHGFMGSKENVPNTFKGQVLDLYKFDEVLRQANATGSVLVVPEAEGRKDSFTYRKYFRDPDREHGETGPSAGEKFDAYLSSVTTNLKENRLISAEGISSIALSAHSGAGQTVSDVLQNFKNIPADSWRRKIDGLALLDAAYGNPTVATLRSMFQAHEGNVAFLNVYTSSQNKAKGTSDYSIQQKRGLQDSEFIAVGGEAFRRAENHFSLVAPGLREFWATVQNAPVEIAQRQNKKIDPEDWQG